MAGQRQCRAGRRVFGGIVQQVDQHTLHQHRIHMQQRQAGWQIGAYHMPGQAAVHLPQGTAHQLFGGQPFALEMHAALLHARHGQQVVHQLLQCLGLVADLHQHVCRRTRRHPWQGRLGCAQNTGQRRTQIVRHR
ncbi:hypothetical protein D3C71_1732880 [compost metagenome]